MFSSLFLKEDETDRIEEPIVPTLQRVATDPFGEGPQFINF